MTLLESREKCEIKLTKPLKFLTGRKDCVRVPSPDEDSINPGEPYSDYKEEVSILRYLGNFNLLLSIVIKLCSTNYFNF